MEQYGYYLHNHNGDGHSDGSRYGYGQYMFQKTAGGDLVLFFQSQKETGDTDTGRGNQAQLQGGVWVIPLEQNKN